MDKTLIKKKIQLFDAATQVGMKAVTEKGTYYFIPFWFKEHGAYDMEVVPFEKLPQDLKDELQKHRNNANNGQQDNSKTDSWAAE